MLLKIRPINQQSFATLLEQCKILKSEDDGAPKVLLNPNTNLIYKIYRKRNLNPFKQMTWYRCWRFIRISKGLKHRGITAPDILQYLYYPTEKARIVVYKKVAGDMLAEHINRENIHIIIKKLAYFFKQLHDMNIYFRAAHAENILVQNGEFALIDVDNCRFVFHMSARRRAKNIAYFFKHAKRLNKELFTSRRYFDLFLTHYHHHQKPSWLFSYWLKRYNH